MIGQNYSALRNMLNTSKFKYQSTADEGLCACHVGNPNSSSPTQTELAIPTIRHQSMANCSRHSVGSRSSFSSAIQPLGRDQLCP